MALESTARRQLAEATPLYRTAPHNIELEQALLGAILVNNEAFYRVSDFLEPRHFFEPIHQKVCEVTASLRSAPAPLESAASDGYAGGHFKISAKQPAS